MDLLYRNQEGEEMLNRLFIVKHLPATLYKKHTPKIISKIISRGLLVSGFSLALSPVPENNLCYSIYTWLRYSGTL